MKLVGNARFQKAANGSLVLNYLMRHGDATRSTIAREVGLTASTVTYIVQRLIDAGLVEEHDPPVSGGRGCRGVNVGLNTQFGRVIGCDLQADYYVAVITDVAGRVVNRFRREYTIRTGTFERLLERVLGEIATEVAGNIPVIGAGIALPGIVSVDEPLIEACWTLGIDHLDIRAFLERTFSYTVLLENDANACAWKTLWYERSRATDAFLYLLPRFHRRELLTGDVPSVGIGMGLVYNGAVYRGITNRAGEFVSNAWRPTGTGPGQLAMSAADLDRVRDDRTARRRLVEELFNTLAQFVFMTDPRSLYIGGDLAGERELIHQVLRGEFRWFEELFKRNGGSIVVLDDAAYDPALGAAANVLDKLYSVPRLGGEPRRGGGLETTLTTIGDRRAVLDSV